MLPNKSVAALLLGILFLAALPPSQAQTQQSDLDVVAVTYRNPDKPGYSDPRVEQNVEILVTIRNAGNAPFAPTAGWQLFIGHKSEAEGNDPVTASDCIETSGPSTIGASQPCYYRFEANSEYGSFDAGDEETITLTGWTPSDNQAGQGYVVTKIMPYGSVVGQEDSVFTGPDDVTSNNEERWRAFVANPAVRARADRDAVSTGKSPDDAWALDEVTEPCLPEPTVNRKGCRPLPDQAYRFGFKVQNEGNVDDVYTAALVAATQGDNYIANLTARGYRFDFGQPLDIPAGAPERDAYLTIYVPKTEKADDTLNVDSIRARVRWSSSITPSVDTDDVDCNEDQARADVCESPSLPSLRVAAVRGIRLESNDTLRAVQIDQRTFFNLSINNTGNDEDTYDVTWNREGSTINDSWDLLVTEAGEIVPGRNASATLSVQPPDNATKGHYKFDVIVASDNDPTQRGNFTFTADLQQFYRLFASFDRELTQVPPADTARYVLTVRNNGNGMDNVTLSVENGRPGWVTEVSTRTLQIPAFSEAKAYFNITPPANAAADLESAVFVNVTSQGPPNLPVDQRATVTDLVVRTVVRASPNLAITPPEIDSFVDRGTTKNFTLTVQNTGNLASNFTLTAATPSDVSWGVSVTPDHVVLNPLESKSVVITLRAPDSGAVGDTVTGFVTARSLVNAGIFRDISVAGAVSGPDLAVTSATIGSAAPYTGDLVPVTLVVANKGNLRPSGPATLQAFFVQNGIESAIHTEVIPPDSLPGGRSFSTSFTWDTSPYEGVGALLVRIDADNTIPEIDESATSNEAAQPVTLRTPNAIRVTAAAGLSGAPGERLAYSEIPHAFAVVYEGKMTNESVEIRLASEHGWISAAESVRRVTLLRGTPEIVRFNVQIPALPGVAEDTVTLTVTPTLRPQAQLVATTKTSIVDTERPVILGVTANPASLTAGENVTLEARVRDATGVSQVTAYVVDPTNSTTAVPLLHREGELWSRSQSFRTPGTYRFYVDALDGSEAGNLNTSRESLASFTVAPSSLPTIKLADGQTAVIRNGTTIQFNITDPAGIARVTYTVRGVVHQMGRGYTVDTTGFTGETIDMTVEAENTYGGKSTAPFSFTLDNSPPEIRAVTITPEKPNIQEDVTVRIETDAQVRGVKVIIKRDNQLVETLDATRRSSGVYELVFNPGEGTYTLDVTATDEAGNAEIQAAAVQFTAKPKSPFDVPAPSLGLLLAALGVALVVLRRRA